MTLFISVENCIPHLSPMRARLAMFVQIALGLERDITRRARIRSLASVCSYMLLKHTWFGAPAAAVRANVAARFGRMLTPTAA